MDISKIEKWSPSSNVYDDLRGVDSLSRSKVPSRSTSTIGYISPREMENPPIKRPMVSLILPTSSSEQMTTIDTILSIDDAKQSIEQGNTDLLSNNLIFKEANQSFVCWTAREIIQLICVALFACLVSTLAFTLIFYAFDVYWIEQPIVNNSSWWWLDNNGTNFTGVDYDIINTKQTINYDYEY